MFVWWDLFLHSLSGIILGLIGFSIAYMIFYYHKIDISPHFVTLFTITFAISLGALWEIIEFSLDSIFGFNMQKSGLVDTMWDLIVDMLGAAIIGAAGYLYIKKPRKGIIDRIVRKLIRLNYRVLYYRLNKKKD